MCVHFSGDNDTNGVRRREQRKHSSKVQSTQFWWPELGQRFAYAAPPPRAERTWCRVQTNQRITLVSQRNRYQPVPLLYRGSKGCVPPFTGIVA